MPKKHQFTDEELFSEETELKRQLGLTEAFAIVISRIIGSGIFRTPAPIMMLVGAISLFYGVWILGGIATLLGAFLYAELAAMMPKSGGPYQYLKAAYPPIVTFLRGWAMFFVSETAAIAAVALVFAEYGNAMSGIVNIITKDGSREHKGSFTTYLGDNLSSHDGIFTNINDFDPTSIRNFDLSLNGPIVQDKLYYFINARHIYFDGWLHGQEIFKPGNVPFFDTEGNFVPHLNPVKGKGSGDFVAMNWNRKNYGQAKFLFRVAPGINFTSSTIYDQVDYQDYDRNYKLNPEGMLQRFKTGVIQLFKLTHALNPTTFYDLGISGIFKEYKDYAYEDPQIGRASCRERV